MFDGILFDLDGTLWDAVPEITLCWNHAIAAAGVVRSPLTIPELQRCMGQRLPDIAQALFPDLGGAERLVLIDRCCREETAYLSRCGATLYPGEAETLSKLSAEHPLFVVSNCQDGYIQAFYAGTGLGQWFTDFECAGRTGRPKAENIALVVARHGLKRPVYIGDTDLDRSSAEAAGVAFVHAAYGYGKVRGVPAARRFSELPDVLAGLTGVE